MAKKKEETQLVEYDVTIAAIEEMKQKYTGMTITDAASDKAVRAARTFMVSKRTSVEKRRIELNEEANKHRRRVNDKAKEITALLLPIEEPLQAECKRVDDEREAKRVEKEQKERKRVEDIQAQIAAISRTSARLPGMDLKGLKLLSDNLEDVEISDDFAEFKDEATKVLEDIFNAVQDAITARIKLDKEDAERKAEAERLEAQRKEQEAAQAKIDAAQKKIDDEKAKLEADKKAAQAKEDFNTRVTTVREETVKELKAEQAQAERDRLAKEEAEAKEKARQEALKPDRSKKEDFANYLQEKIPYPELQLDEFKELLKSIKTQLYDLGNEIFEALEG